MFLVPPVHAESINSPVHVEAAATSSEAVQVISIDDLIHQTVTKYGLNYQHFYATLSCESEGFKDVAIQSQVPDPKGPNGRENSWGLAQIWLDPGGHPEVTKTQATDPAFAIDFAGRLFSIGQETQFHCYKKEEANGWKLY